MTEAIKIKLLMPIGFVLVLAFWSGVVFAMLTIHLITAALGIFEDYLLELSVWLRSIIRSKNT